MPAEFETLDPPFKPAVESPRHVGEDPIPGIPRINSGKSRAIDIFVIEIKRDPRWTMTRQIVDSDTTGNISANKRCFQPLQRKSPIRKPVRIFTGERGRMPVVEINDF